MRILEIIRKPSLQIERTAKDINITVNCEFDGSNPLDLWLKVLMEMQGKVSAILAKDKGKNIYFHISAKVDAWEWESSTTETVQQAEPHIITLPPLDPYVPPPSLAKLFERITEQGRTSGTHVIYQTDPEGGVEKWFFIGVADALRAQWFVKFEEVNWVKLVEGHNRMLTDSHNPKKTGVDKESPIDKFFDKQPKYKPSIIVVKGFTDFIVHAWKKHSVKSPSAMRKILSRLQKLIRREDEETLIFFVVNRPLECFDFTDSIVGLPPPRDEEDEDEIHPDDFNPAVAELSKEAHLQNEAKKEVMDFFRDVEFHNLSAEENGYRFRPNIAKNILTALKTAYSSYAKRLHSWDQSAIAMDEPLFLTWELATVAHTHKLNWGMADFAEGISYLFRSAESIRQIIEDTKRQWFKFDFSDVAYYFDKYHPNTRFSEFLVWYVQWIQSKIAEIIPELQFDWKEESWSSGGVLSNEGEHLAFWFLLATMNKIFDSYGTTPRRKKYFQKVFSEIEIDPWESVDAYIKSNAPSAEDYKTYPKIRDLEEIIFSLGMGRPSKKTKLAQGTLKLYG